MSCKHFLLVCATLTCFYWAAVIAQNGTPSSQIPRTRFTCQGRAAGYYADVETGCQVYHMCDGLGRQFSYTCPNTTLFQQRMLICDHWYMVNCSKSESDYDANLLIGQRDKPFVSEEEMRLRTPRPDILSVPPNNNYYDGLREAETKFPLHPGNSIVGIADTISNVNNNGLDSGKNYRPPTSWSTGVGVKGQSSSKRPSNQEYHEETGDNIAGAASQGPVPTFRPTPQDSFTKTTSKPSIPTPSQDLHPPLPPITTTTEASEEMDIDVRMKTDSSEDPVYNFIKRFDPNSPTSHKTAMTKSEILNINENLPAGQVSSEEERTPRKNKNEGVFNSVQQGNDKNFTEKSRFDTVNIKPTTAATTTSFADNVSKANQVPEPEKELLPPKTDLSEQPSTTMGPPIYYEWKWAVPAFDLEPPKQNNGTNDETPKAKVVQGRSPFSSVTRPPPVTVDPTPSNTEYNISSYFIPDYIFPLDKPHPGYDDENAETSFQVKVARPGRASYGENPNCPQCHPAYLNPGSCEPCIVKR
ncbi:jiangshi [Aphomia sociella]